MSEDHTTSSHATRFTHVAADLITRIGATMSDRFSAHPILTAMGARIVADDKGVHLRNGHEINGCLAGEASPDTAAAMAAEIREACLRIPTSIDAVSLDLLRSTGLDVPAALALVLAAEIAQPGTDNPVRLFAKVDPATGRSMGPMRISLLGTRARRASVRIITAISTELAHGVVWAHGAAYVPPVPETVATAAPGRPLADILTHRVLDRHALTIDTIKVEQDINDSNAPSQAMPGGRHVITVEGNVWIPLRDVHEVLLAPPVSGRSPPGTAREGGVADRSRNQPEDATW